MVCSAALEGKPSPPAGIIAPTWAAAELITSRFNEADVRVFSGETFYCLAEQRLGKNSELCLSVSGDSAERSESEAAKHSWNNSEQRGRRKESQECFLKRQEKLHNHFLQRKIC